MPKVRIYRPDKTAMQSGKASGGWLLECVPDEPMGIDPLMGWNSMPDTLRQIRLFFPTKAKALAYATRQRLVFEVIEPKPRYHLRKAYADNFAFHRMMG